MLRVQRLRARATLDDPEPTLAEAEARAAAGDDSWARWVEEYRRGEALIVRLEVTLEALDGDREVLEIANRGVFIENDRHPPKVEQQVAEVATKDFSALAHALAARGHDVEEAELHMSFVHVELGDDVRRSLLDAARRGASDRPQAELSLADEEHPPEPKR